MPTLDNQEISLTELINPTARQWEFWEAVAASTFICYGGAAGGGKSYILRWTLVVLLIEWHRVHGYTGIRVGLFCEDYPALEDRQISKVRTEFPSWLGKYHETRHEFELAAQYGGGVICFRNLDQPSKYDSAEFAAIAVDELTRNEASVFDELRKRRRWKGISDTKFLAATNPGRVGHLWVKSIWIDRELPNHLASEYSLADFAFVKAMATDNPHNDASYIKELRSLPPNLRRAMYEGDWDAFEGQVFQEFRESIHVIKPFAIPDWWARWRSNDPGFSDPAVWYEFAADQDGQVYCIKERTFDERTTHGEQAKIIDRDWGRPPLEFTVTGMDAFVRDPDSQRCPVDFYLEGGLENFIEPDHGAGCRIRRAGIVHEYLKPFDKVIDATTDPAQPVIQTLSRVRIFDTCRKLIMTLPALPADENNPEQVKECSSDHWYDAFGYGLQAWHTERSRQPRQPAYKPGSFGQLLNHEKVWNPDQGSGRNLLVKGLSK